MDGPVVSARSLSKVYGRSSGVVKALDAINVGIAWARFTTIMEPSDSGKSTLMYCLAGLGSTTSGEIMLDGDTTSFMNQRHLTHLRRERTGFIFQSFNLVPTLTAVENITLPLSIARKKVDPQRFDRVIDTVGLRERLSHRLAEFSGGQVQRVAYTRMLVGESTVVFVDEPIGNLDSHSTDQVLEILRRGVDDLEQSVIMATHEPETVAWTSTVIFLYDGHIIARLDDPDRDRVLDALRELNKTEPIPAAAPQSDSAVKGA